MRHALRTAAARLLRYVLTCVAFLTLVFWAFVADASPLLPHSIKGIACNRAMHCVAHDSPGGLLKDYERLGHMIRGAHGRLTVRGFCASGCAILADRVRGRACLAGGAQLEFHQGQAAWPDGRMTYEPNRYSRPVQAWIDAHGGEPVDPTRSELLTMPASEARKFFPACR